MGLRPAVGFSDLTRADMPGAFLVGLRPADSLVYTGCLLSLLPPQLGSQCVPVSASGFSLSLFCDPNISKHLPGVTHLLQCRGGQTVTAVLGNVSAGLH